METVQQPSLVLWDLHDGNIIVNPENGELQAIIDGDRALWGDPLMDFPFRSFMTLSERWLTIYSQNLKLNCPIVDKTNTDAQVRIAWYDLYLALVMIIESVYRQYPPGHDSWAREMGTDAVNKLEGLLT